MAVFGQSDMNDGGKECQGVWRFLSGSGFLSFGFCASRHLLFFGTADGLDSTVVKERLLQKKPTGIYCERISL